MSRATRPRATGAISALPIIITERNAPVALGLDPRPYRALAEELDIPRKRVGHLTLTVAEDWAAAVRRDASRGHEDVEISTADEPQSVDDVLARIGRRRIAVPERAAEVPRDVERRSVAGKGGGR